jgi:nitronate monooxygenase
MSAATPDRTDPARHGHAALRANLRKGLAVPVIAAPMFLVSGPEHVMACCRAGIIGTFPTINARTTDILDQWLGRMAEGHAPGAARHAANLIVHKSNARIDEDLALVVRHKVPLVISSVGSPARVVEGVHGYGGLVLADVATLKHARRAAETGVDGLILLTAGCGGNTGWLNPFGFAAAVREFWDGPLVVAGAIGNGRQIRALEVLDVDLAYVGTRVIAASESMAGEAYRELLIGASIDDIFLTDAITGIPANFLRSSLERAGFDTKARHAKPEAFNLDKETRAWRDVWSAGHGVGAVKKVQTVAEIVAELSREYASARD